MNILLTGAQGNLGKSILGMGDNHKIIPVGRKEWLDIDNIFPTKGLDIVIHAASNLKSKIDKNPSEIVQSDIATTAKLLELSAKSSVKRFIFISSCAVYGNSSSTSEDVLCVPISMNGMLKHLNEKIVESFCKTNKLNYSIFRIFNLFGGQDTFSVLSHLRRALNENASFNLNNDGISQRDFIHVEDVAKCVLKLIEIQNLPEFINLGSGRSTRVGEVFELVKSRFPHLPFHRSATKEVEYSRADVSRLNSLVDCDFKDVLEFVKTTDYFRSK